MKYRPIITLSILIIFLISCKEATDNNQHDKRNIEVESEPKPIAKEDTTVKVLDIHDDTTPVKGILEAVQESDFWGRVYLTIIVEGKKRSFEYYDLKGEGNFDNLDDLIGKKVLVKFRREETLVEKDLHINNKTIHGEYGMISTEKQIKDNAANKIEGNLIVHEHDRSGDLPSDYRILNKKGDTLTIKGFVYDSHVALNGKKATVYYYIETTYIARSITSLEEDNQNANKIFIGKWKKEDLSNPIDPTFFEIKKKGESDYAIKYNSQDYFVPANLISGILKGKSNSRNFMIKRVSENPPIISYSDDGRGHFEPNRNVRFIKVKTNAELLIGKWQSTDNKYNVVVFNKTQKIETNIDYEYLEGYELTSECLNKEIPLQENAKDEKKYISGLKSEMCWYIISIDDENLSISDVGGRGNTLNYKRVK
jgi:small nuclear ribonucleoprotein (snRNP)-like protein